MIKLTDSDCNHLSPGVPSAPRNVVSVVNQTSVQLEWHPPRDIGYRDDLTYNVVCRRCHSSERRACQPCDDGVAFVSGKQGLKDTKVEISKLRAHTSYTFEIQVRPSRETSSFLRLHLFHMHAVQATYSSCLLAWRLFMYSFEL